MKTVKRGLAAALALLIAAPPAAAQQMLKVSAREQTPSFSFTKDLTPAAPIPRLDLTPITNPQQQLPDPTGLIAASEDAKNNGADVWVWGGLLMAGVGGSLLYLEDELTLDPDDKFFKYMGWGSIAVGAAFFTAGVFSDRGPQPWVSKTRGGVAGGLRIPVGRR